MANILSIVMYSLNIVFTTLQIFKRNKQDHSTNQTSINNYVNGNGNYISNYNQTISNYQTTTVQTVLAQNNEKDEWWKALLIFILVFAIYALFYKFIPLFMSVLLTIVLIVTFFYNKTTSVNRYTSIFFSIYALCICFLSFSTLSMPISIEHMIEQVSHSYNWQQPFPSAIKNYLSNVGAFIVKIIINRNHFFIFYIAARLLALSLMAWRSITYLFPRTYKADLLRWNNLSTPQMVFHLLKNGVAFVFLFIALHLTIVWTFIDYFLKTVMHQ
ncbi:MULTISPECIES: hypothetical protein [unclassified Sporolactobacillus]|uniref:hypothetical protein n=1 Tax=unclassified Sporolactobacillus TaxID=2628533 RepID=UPI0023687536|nr:hypothetical protein [Sporolactobacillus sp. CQH2019]MDD9150427.1 hypothetical protein [Sporolactobacillus sp. CQH2019]